MTPASRCGMRHHVRCGSSHSTPKRSLFRAEEIILLLSPWNFNHLRICTVQEIPRPTVHVHFYCQDVASVVKKNLTSINDDIQAPLVDVKSYSSVCERRCAHLFLIRRSSTVLFLAPSSPHSIVSGRVVNSWVRSFLSTYRKYSQLFRGSLMTDKGNV